MRQTVLVVEDEAKIAALCRDYLAADGFNVQVSGDGLGALEIARSLMPDLIVLDVMLPGMDGFSVCRTLRAESDVPIIILTAKVDEADTLHGLALGADDYITKPFSPRELVARVRTVLRRSDPAATDAHGDSSVTAGDLTLDRGTYQVHTLLGSVALTPTEFELLATLMGTPGRIFSRQQLLRAVRGVAFESYERAIDSHIRNLRKKIEPDRDARRYIVTVHGVGYKFVP